VVCKPGSLKAYKKFEAEIYVLTKDEGGRHTAFFSNYRPQFYMRTADITGRVELPENVKMVMPGDNATAVFELISHLFHLKQISKPHLLKHRNLLAWPICLRSTAYGDFGQGHMLGKSFRKVLY
ncbi:hypothetical protein ACLOJK_041958, partial [Asimina triloba]